MKRLLIRTSNTFNKALDQLTLWTGVLVLPLSALLFAQWPMRDLGLGGSRNANDIAQWVFALYVAFALRHTTRVQGHMAADGLAARYPQRWRDALARWGQALCLLPWAIYVLLSGAPTVWLSVRNLERFPDTFNALYFVIKLSASVLAGLMAIQSVLDLIVLPGSGSEA